MKTAFVPPLPTAHGSIAVPAPTSAMAASGSSLVTQLAVRYNAAVTSQPFAVNATTGFVIASLGDIACQKWFEKKAEWDAKRTLDMGLIRAFVMAPFMMAYFPFLNRLVPGKKAHQVLSRVALDQCIGSPISIVLTFSAAGLLKGDVREVPARISNQMLPTWKNGVVYWPFVHSLNFRFMPVMHQPLVAHVASLWWNGVLSYRANLAIPGHEHNREGKELHLHLPHLKGGVQNASAQAGTAGADKTGQLAGGQPQRGGSENQQQEASKLQLVQTAASAGVTTAAEGISSSSSGGAKQ